MVSINEHPFEMAHKLLPYYYLKVQLRHNDLMIATTLYLKLGSIIEGESTIDTDLPICENLLQSVHYLAYPRDYIIIKVSALFDNDFLLDIGWQRLEPGWYIRTGLAALFPCSWRLNAHHTQLIRYHVECITEID